MRRKSFVCLILACVMLVCGPIPASAAGTDADGLVTAAAARYVLRVARGLEEPPRDESAFSAVDLDGDGAVTEADFTGMLRLSVGLDAFDLPDRSKPDAAETAPDDPENTKTAADGSGGGSSSVTDYWEKPWGPVPGALPKGETGKYAVNTNTGKFHYVSCRWVNEIYPENRTDSDADRQEIVDAGYTPCKVCCP